MLWLAEDKLAKEGAEEELGDEDIAADEKADAEVLGEGAEVEDVEPVEHEEGADEDEEEDEVSMTDAREHAVYASSGSADGSTCAAISVIGSCTLMVRQRDQLQSY